MQEHITESNYTAHALPCINSQQTAAKMNFKVQQTLWVFEELASHLNNIKNGGHTL